MAPCTPSAGCSSSPSRPTYTSGHDGARHRRVRVTHSRRGTAAAWVSVTVLSLAGAVPTVMASGPLTTPDIVGALVQAPSAVLYATLGALVVRRAGNTIGWLLLGIGAGLAAQTFTSDYAVLG